MGFFMIRISAFVALLVSLVFSGLSAGTFNMDTGEKIKGKLFILDADSAKIQTDYGLVVVPFKKIVSMDFSGESFDYLLTLKDSSLVKGNLISYSDELFVINTTAGIINISAKNIIECIESGYANKIKQDIVTEEANLAMGRVDHLRLSVGYGLLLGDFTDKYNPGVHVTLGYDRPIFTGALNNFRFGIMGSYENMAARNVEKVSLDTLTFLATGRYIFSFTTEGFFSHILPFMQIGAGGSLLRLNYSNGTNEAGLNPALFAAVGIDFAITSWFDVSLQCDYLGVLESPVNLHEIRFGGGLMFKL